ncbi:MAG TPA: hypothetical protein VKP64_13040 [Mycobacteriales bacterium]|nr:hypothetical protein [Mycobacteriales bacterium]
MTDDTWDEARSAVGANAVLAAIEAELLGEDSRLWQRLRALGEDIQDADLVREHLLCVVLRRRDGVGYDDADESGARQMYALALDGVGRHLRDVAEIIDEEPEEA